MTLILIWFGVCLATNTFSDQSEEDTFDVGHIDGQIQEVQRSLLGDRIKKGTNMLLASICEAQCFSLWKRREDRKKKLRAARAQTASRRLVEHPQCVDDLETADEFIRECKEDCQIFGDAVCDGMNAFKT